MSSFGPGYPGRARSYPSMIPGWARSTSKTEADRLEAAATIKAEQAERKLAKSRGRDARMLAAKSGDTKRMPLQGKDALAAIRG